MPMTTVSDLLDLLRREPGRPRVTWYAAAGERVELSAAVLENWVSKTTNLLVEELDAGPGTRVLIDLPAHWRTVVWALATWRAGACVELPPGEPGSLEGRGTADVVVTDRPDAGPARAASPDGLVVVSLPALARRFDGALPARAIDAASAVMTYGDAIGWAPATDPAAPALVIPGDGTLPHGELMAWAGAGVQTEPGARVLVHPSAADRGESVAALLRTVLAVLARNGSVVALDASTSAELAADPARSARLVASERVTAEVAAPRAAASPADQG